MVCVPYVLMREYMCMITEKRKGVADGLNHCYVCFCVWYIFLITLVPCKNEMKDASVLFKYEFGTVAWLASYCW